MCQAGAASWPQTCGGRKSQGHPDRHLADQSLLHGNPLSPCVTGNNSLWMAVQSCHESL